jgi:hypothetical protein
MIHKYFQDWYWVGSQGGPVPSLVTESHCVAQTGLKLAIILCQCPECRDYRHEPPHSALLLCCDATCLISVLIPEHISWVSSCSRSHSALLILLEVGTRNSLLIYWLSPRAWFHLSCHFSPICTAILCPCLPHSASCSFSLPRSAAWPCSPWLSCLFFLPVVYRRLHTWPLPSIKQVSRPFPTLRPGVFSNCSPCPYPLSHSSSLILLLTLCLLAS